MQYKSPISLISYAGFDKTSLDEAAILKMEERLLVEADRSGGSLAIRNQTYSKDDILRLISELRDPEIRLFHFWIAENSSLKDLLEKNVILFRPATLYNIRLRDEPQFQKFKDFVSPYLAGSFSTGISKNINDLDFAAARRFFLGGELMVENDRVEAFERIKPALTSFIEMIRRVRDRQLAFDRRKFSFVENQFVDFLNDLPDSFQSYRDKIAIALIELSTVYQQWSDTFFQDLFFRLAKLKCSPGVTNAIGGNVTETKKSVETEASWKKNRYGVVALIGLTIFSMYSIANRCKEKDRVRVYVPPVERIVPSEVHQYHLQKTLKELALKQIDPVTKDSMAKIISKTTTGSMGDFPYPSHFNRLDDYAPAKGIPTNLVNESQYDAVVFVRNASKRYTTFLKKGEKIETHLSNRDRVSFYIGNDWHSDSNIQVRDVAGERVSMNGIFARVDSQTLKYLDNHYQLQCDATCKVINMKLNSSKDGGVQLEIDASRFSTKRESDIFYWR